MESNENILEETFPLNSLNDYKTLKENHICCIRWYAFIGRTLVRIQEEAYKFRIYYFKLILISIFSRSWVPKNFERILMLSFWWPRLDSNQRLVWIYICTALRRLLVIRDQVFPYAPFFGHPKFERNFFFEKLTNLLRNYIAAHPKQTVLLESFLIVALQKHNFLQTFCYGFLQDRFRDHRAPRI